MNGTVKLLGMSAQQITHAVKEVQTPGRDSQFYELLPISLCSLSLKILNFEINESEEKVTQSLLGCFPSKQDCQE